MPIEERKPPSSEKGLATTGVGLQPWAQLVEDNEYVPLLMFPQSVKTYEKMFTDAQVKGLYSGTVLPLQRFRYRLNPNGAKAQVVSKLSTDYGIPIKGKEEDFKIGRRRGRFSWSKHLELLLKYLLFGFYYFEQVGEVNPEKYGDEYWHLKKLAPRPPRTVSEALVEKDGGLKGIKQLGVINSELGSPDIPITQLLCYVNEQEGGNWYGTSLLRSVYRNWLIKDRLLRVDALKHEKNGMGTAVFKAPPDADADEMAKYEALARSQKVHEEGGVAVPDGADFKLVGVTGSIPDTVASINMHNEEMARNFLMMFMNLSQGSSGQGSYALGSSFLEFFAFAQEQYASYICDTFTAHMLEDDVDWNWGPDEQCPVLEWMRPEYEDIPTADLALLVEKGIIKMDPELEEIIRSKYHLPKRPEDAPTPEPPVPPQPEPELEEEEEETPPEPEPSTVKAGGDKKRRRTRAVAADTPLSLPPRDLRRQPYDFEIAAQVDFAMVDSVVTSSQLDVVQEVSVLQQQQIVDLHDQIVDAGGDLVKLSKIKAAPIHEDTILKHLEAVAQKGAEGALQEAKAQGVSAVNVPDASEWEDLLNNRAKAVDQVLATSISEAAQRQAINRTGGSLSASEVADQVQEHLEGLSNAYLKEQLGGAMTQGLNTGRKAVMRVNEPEKIYASELLDTNTCTNCTAKDGTEYLQLSDAERDYPTGGYSECEGGPRCRGTLVAVYPESQPTLDEPGI